MKILFIFWALLCSSCYSLKQAYHFTSLYSSKVSVTEALKDDEVPKRIKKRLRTVIEVNRYALNEGLNSDGAYASYIHTSTASVSHLVQAAERDRLKFKTWWFPFVGTVPYLGFFDKNDRDEKYNDLKKSYDVSKSRVGAFSSLGWFEDPIYTSMLRSRYQDLVHLFFHELVHRTYWSSGSVKFNENLAEFGAEILTAKFLREKDLDAELSEYFAKKRDKVKYRKWLKSLRADLKVLYRKRSLGQNEILSRKENIFKDYRLSKIPNFETKRYSYIKNKKWNNASVLGASLYAPDIERFYRAYRCLGKPSIGDFLKSIEEAESLYENNFVALDSFCKPAGQGVADVG